MTLDEMLAQSKQLGDEDFDVLLGAMMREKESRDSRAEKEAWQKVMDTIDNYTKNFGPIVINDTREIELWRGNYTSTKPGEIEVEA